MRDVIKQYSDLAQQLVSNGLYTDDNPVTLGEEHYFSFKYDNEHLFLKHFHDEAFQLATGEVGWIQAGMPVVEDRSRIYAIEEFEREKILNDLKFATHISISKYGERSNSRRFVSVNDSCLSFTQVTVSPKMWRWVFVSRSTEVNRMLPADLLTISYIISKWTMWFRQYWGAYSKDITIESEKGVSIFFLLNNPHYYR